jgi:hypothetical protein
MRTAGSSLGNIFKELSNHNIINYIDCMHRKHIQCEEYCESQLQGSWRSGIKISTTREPYENTVSLFVRANGIKGVGMNVSKLQANATPEQKATVIKTFRSRLKARDNYMMREMKRQGEILFGPSGKIAHDYIVRFETLNQDILRVLTDLDLLDSAKELKHYNYYLKRFTSKKDIDIDEWFDKETKDIVYNLREKEFKEFKYPR